MAKFTYLPGPGDYTLTLLDPHSSFATIDWERIGWEEAVRRANLFCASESMLTLLEKALPIIENEAELREASMVRHGEDKCVIPYWTEMHQLANTIRAEIGKARGDAVIDAELCSHGFGFIEYCEDCNQKEIKAKWREKGDSHG